MAYKRSEPEQPEQREPEQMKPEHGTRTVFLSDGQEFIPDISLRPILDSWYRGEGTAYQGQLATLSLCYGVVFDVVSEKEL